MVPPMRRQDVQWSSVIIGRRSLTLFGEKISFLGSLGILGRASSSGMEIVYRIALQKQPPLSWNAVSGRPGILNVVEQVVLGTSVTLAHGSEFEMEWDIVRP